MSHPDAEVAGRSSEGRVPEAGSPVLEVVDEGAVRKVRVLRRQKGHFDWDEFRTSWPAGLLVDLAALKGEWFCDSYARFEHPNYIQKNIDIVLQLYGIRPEHLRILDFGCGFGASSYCLAKRGATDIVATDLRAENVDLARRILAGVGYSDVVDVRQEDLVPTLHPDTFDVIWLQAVLEHLLPEERHSYLPRFWKALRPGGWLIITETPNRTWPYETHTTFGRWFLPSDAPTLGLREAEARGTVPRLGRRGVLPVRNHRVVVSGNPRLSGASRRLPRGRP